MAAEYVPKGTTRGVVFMVQTIVKDLRNQKDQLAVAWIVGIYALFSFLWIYLSDSILGLLVHDLDMVTRISVYKGFAFVVVTAILLHHLISRYIQQSRQAAMALKNSEEKLRYASTAADIGMWHWDLINNELIWDERCKEFFGYPPNYPMTYEAFLQPILKEDRQRIDGAVQQALKEKTEYSVEMRVVLSDGKERWVMSKGRGFYDDQGKPVRMHGITMDITERKLAEAEIQRLASFPLMNPNPVLELDATGQMTFCNPAAKQILENAGYNNGINPLIPQDMLVILQNLRNKKADHFFREIEINGRFFKELIYIAPPYQSVRIYTMDITRSKQAEVEIEKLNMSLAARAAELEAANLELEAFNYSVAHDLRQPLNVIGGYSQAIKELCGDNLDEQCKGYLQGSYESTLRMNRLIEALLNFSRMGHVEPQQDLIDLCALAREVVLIQKQSEPERKVDFRIAEGIAANGDENLMRVVLENLLGNAWKYTDMREETVIELGATDIDGNTVFFVRDNGNGFNMADADKLFAPFQRLPGAEKSRGFGIGLATVERIIRRHGGRIWAEGEPGRGATFYFTLSSD
jgi:PAS domain S-box-containing protein